MFRPHGAPTKTIAPTALDTGTLPPPPEYQGQWGEKQSRGADTAESHREVRAAPAWEAPRWLPQHQRRELSRPPQARLPSQETASGQCLPPSPTAADEGSSKRKSGFPPVGLAPTSAAPGLCSIRLEKTNGCLDPQSKQNLGLGGHTGQEVPSSPKLAAPEVERGPD